MKKQMNCTITMQIYRQGFVEVRCSYPEICPTEDDFENDPKPDVRFHVEAFTHSHPLIKLHTTFYVYIECLSLSLVTHL